MEFLIYFNKPIVKANTKSQVVFHSQSSEKSNQIMIIEAYGEILNHETPLIRFKVKKSYPRGISIEN